MIELFYFNISIIKGVSRIIMLVVLNLDSFYTPAKCAFPDGKESWDGGHLTFVCYAMARVDADKEIQLDTSRRMLRLGIKSIRHQTSSIDDLVRQGLTAQSIVKSDRSARKAAAPQGPTDQPDATAPAAAAPDESSV